jgi:hypothetical protein
MRMYDALTSRYTFSCPTKGEAHVTLSAFRVLERLPGAAHPAVYRVSFSCSCGDEHPGLLSHDDLDYAPLGLQEGEFLNLMTSRMERLARELGDLAAFRIQRGEWPWSFFCYPEERPRPIFPSAFFLLSPSEARGLVGIAVRCPVCGHTSVNVVSHDHVDLPFVNDREVGVVEHVFAHDAESIAGEFRETLHSASFDARRLQLG